MLQASAEEVTNFLAYHFKEGKSYSTLNTYRSALSTTLCPCSGTMVGSHPLVVRFMKGVFHLRPPQPKYDTTWDVSVVINYLRTLFPLEQLTLKMLTFKTVMLCALASAQRGQTLAALDTECMTVSNDMLKFIVCDRLKITRPGYTSVTVSIPAIAEDIAVCPKASVTEYISRTRDIRSSSKLFISFIRPYKHVTVETISRWIKSVLSLAGIDTGIFKAHSVRGAATTAAYDKGVPIQQILSLANWSNETTFRKYYLRSSRHDDINIGTLVLSDTQ